MNNVLVVGHSLGDFRVSHLSQEWNFSGNLAFGEKKGAENNAGNVNLALKARTGS